MFKQFREFQKGEFIICAMDTAAGGNDYCAAQFLSHKWLDVPLVFHAKITCSYATPLIHQKLTDIAKMTGIAPIVAFERNNGGGFEMDRLARLNRFGDYRIYTMKVLSPTGSLVDSGKLGWDTNVATRPKMLQDLKDAVDSRLLHVYYRQTVDELFSFIINSNGKAEAEDNAHDDLVMALAIAFQLYQTEKPEIERGGGIVETTPYGGGYKDPYVLYNGVNEYA